MVRIITAGVKRSFGERGNMNEYYIRINLKTNYKEDEIKEVFDKLMSIPLAEYIDCTSFDYKYEEFWKQK